jgi:L-ribulose-5-phosphate 3-epimerase
MLRRDFLAAAASAPLLSPALLAAKSRIDMSRIAVLTDEVAKSPAEAIAFAKQYGVKWLELRGVPGGGGHYGSLPEDKLKEAAKQFADNGLKVSFLNTGFFKITLPGTEPVFRNPETAERREKRLARAESELKNWKESVRKAIVSAHAFGVDKMRVFTFLRVAEPESVFDRCADVIGEMSQIASREQVKLLVENETACNVVTCAEVARFMKLLPEKWVGVNWDPWNGLALKEQPFPEGYALMPKKRLWNVQMKGHSLLDAERKLDWRSIFGALDKDGYKGNVGLETHYFDGTNLEKSHASMVEIRRLLEQS